jgi:hypothetical protein
MVEHPHNRELTGVSEYAVQVTGKLSIWRYNNTSQRHGTILYELIRSGPSAHFIQSLRQGHCAPLGNV